MGNFATAPALRLVWETPNDTAKTSKDIKQQPKINFSLSADGEHLVAAIKSGTPHIYISERAGRMSDNGGIGFLNAVEMHKALLVCAGSYKGELNVIAHSLLDDLPPVHADVKGAKNSSSFASALRDCRSGYRQEYAEALKPAMVSNGLGL